MSTSTLTTPKRKTLAPATTPAKISEESRVQGTVVHLLDQLGNTIRDWRRNLKKRGIMGHASSSRNCVLAVYFRRGLSTHGKRYTVSVTGGGEQPITVRRGKFHTGLSLPSRTAKKIQQFVDEFDFGNYPELLVTSELTAPCTCPKCQGIGISSVS